MTKEQISGLTAKKHVKIYLLKSIGLTNKEIAEAVGTNAGHVHNALKDYEKNPAKAEEAKKLLG